MYLSEDNKHVMQALFFGLAAVIAVTSGLRYFAYQYEKRDSVAEQRVTTQIDTDVSALAAQVTPVSQGESILSPMRGSVIRHAFAATTPQVSRIPDRQPDTYQLAIENYANHRLQFDNCVMVYPMISATFKSGSEILIEGKSLDPQIVHFAGSEIVLQGPDISLMQLPTVATVTTFDIDCEMLDDRQYNVGRITLYP